MHAPARPSQLDRRATDSPGGKVDQEKSAGRGLPVNPVWRTLATGIQPTPFVAANKSIQAKLTPSATHAETTQGAERAVHPAGRGGHPLPEAAKAFFEPRFGRDFRRVRVHADPAAGAAARAVRARAYVTGSDIVFGAGEYAPATNAGKRLLAHELTHVVQQGGAPVVSPANEPVRPVLAIQRAPAPGLIMREPDCEQHCGTNFEESSGDQTKRLGELSACLHGCAPPASEPSQPAPEQIPAKNEPAPSDPHGKDAAPATPNAPGANPQGDWTPPMGGPYPIEAIDPRVLKAPKTFQGNPPPPNGWKYWPLGKTIKPAAKKLADLGPKKTPGTFIQDIVAGELVGMRSEWHNFTVLFDKETHKPFNKPGLFKGGSLMVPVEPLKQPAAQ